MLVNPVARSIADDEIYISRIALLVSKTFCSASDHVSLASSFKPWKMRLYLRGLFYTSSCRVLVLSILEVSTLEDALRSWTSGRSVLNASSSPCTVCSVSDKVCQFFIDRYLFLHNDFQLIKERALDLISFGKNFWHYLDLCRILMWKTTWV